MSECAIECRSLSKHYKIYNKPSQIIKEVLYRKPFHHYKEVMKDINFTINKGEIVGIIGRNGAGKSTLLKLITGIIKPSQGEIKVNGKISSILELGTGFYPNLSGRKNIYTGAMCLGIKREDIEKKVNWIIDFSELQQVIDEPFYTYSSGMQARLTFATAVAVDPDIFIVDEALAAGDTAFASKCLKRIREICQSGVTSLFVSHSTYHIMQLCSRAIWIDKGEIIMDGPSVDVVKTYEHFCHEEKLKEGQGVDKNTLLMRAKSGLLTNSFKGKHYSIEKVELLDENLQDTRILTSRTEFTLRIHYKKTSNDPEGDTLGLAVAVNRESDIANVMMFNTNQIIDESELQNYEDETRRFNGAFRGIIEAKIKPLQLMEGVYYLSFGLLPNIPGASEFYEYRHYALKFTVKPKGYSEPTIFYPIVEWSHFIKERNLPDEILHKAS